MSIASKIAHKAEAVKGGAKKTAGYVTGSRRLRAKGRRDQAKATSIRPARRSKTPSGTDRLSATSQARAASAAGRTAILAAT